MSDQNVVNKEAQGPFENLPQVESLLANEHLPPLNGTQNIAKLPRSNP